MSINDKIRGAIETRYRLDLGPRPNFSVEATRRATEETKRALDRFLTIMNEHGNPGAEELQRKSYPSKSGLFGWLQPDDYKIEYLGKGWVIGKAGFGPDLLTRKMYVTTEGKLFVESDGLQETTLGSESSNSTQTELERTVPSNIGWRLREHNLTWIDIKD